MFFPDCRSPEMAKKEAERKRFQSANTRFKSSSPLPEPRTRVAGPSSPMYQTIPQSPGEAVSEGAFRRKEGEATLSKEREKKFDMRDILLLNPRQWLFKMCPSQNSGKKSGNHFFTRGPFGATKD